MISYVNTYAGNHIEQGVYLGMCFAQALREFFADPRSLDYFSVLFKEVVTCERSRVPRYQNDCSRTVLDSKKKPNHAASGFDCCNSNHFDMAYFLISHCIHHSISQVKSTWASNTAWSCQHRHWNHHLFLDDMYLLWRHDFCTGRETWICILCGHFDHLSCCLFDGIIRTFDHFNSQ